MPEPSQPDVIEPEAEIGGSNYVSASSDIGRPRLGNAWRDADGLAHATVRLGAATLFFDSPALARATAAACEAAAEALEAVPPATA
jgi:hypothetical protein